MAVQTGLSFSLPPLVESGPFRANVGRSSELQAAWGASPSRDVIPPSFPFLVQLGTHRGSTQRKGL